MLLAVLAGTVYLGVFLPYLHALDKADRGVDIWPTN